jgi:hypothetical protein
MGQTETLRERAVSLAREIQAFPYIWPCPPDAAFARENRAGSCASKHALLAEELARLGIEGTPLLVTGPLVPAALRDDVGFKAGRDLLEVHECLSVLTPWAGPLRVDITWDPPLIARGIPGTVDWDGVTDMAVAIGESGPGWAVPRERLREAKEALRTRLYGPGERALRDQTLRQLAERFARWRQS